MSPEEYYRALKQNPKGIRFEALCRAAVAFGFRLRGVKGSHHIFVRHGVRELVNLQEVDGMAKPYQVRQFCTIIERYRLLEEER
jgi:hypothetical protein